jgi:5-methylcytosine-specific restriction protein B
MADWSEFVEWAEELVDAADLDSDERRYKLVAAERWREALDAARGETAEWPALLRRAAGSGNLVDPFAQTWLRNQIEARAVDVREAFVALADGGMPEDIDAFSERLRSWGDYISPGDITTFASLTLMATSPESRPPYRAQFVTDWGSLVGLPSSGSPTERYVALLALCDEFMDATRGTKIQLSDRLDAQGAAWMVLRRDPPVRWPPLKQAELTTWRQGKASAEVSVDRGAGVAPRMEEGAWLVLGHGLRGETSAIDPDLQTWTVGNARDLRKRIETNPPGGGGFMDKLAGQMAGADDEVIVLLAELLYLRNAPLSDMKDETKVARANVVLGWCSRPRTLAQPLIDAMDKADAFKGGQGYHAQTPAHLMWLTRFVEHWVETPETRRAAGLRDPFAFRDISASTPGDMPSIRYVIEYLAWPGVFPSVVSADHRTKIHAVLMADLGEPSGNDDRAITQDLVALQAFHNRKAKGHGERYMWYRSPYRERWNPGADIPPRAWIVRPGDGGSALVDSWLDQSFVSLSAKMLGTVEPGSPEPVVSKAVKEGYTHLDASQREATAAAYHAFLTLMKDDDIVATIEGGRVYAGVVSGAARYVDEVGSRLRRDVLWSETPVEQGDLAAPLPSLLDQQGAVVDATSAYDILADLAATAGGGDHDDDGTGPVVEKSSPATTPKLPGVTQHVAASLHMNQADLQEIVDLLQQRQQIVLYGPPGTGKTYVAKELAKHLVGDPSRVRLVQFHPSYSYEDFFEGYRPVIDNGQPTFDLKDGPLRLLAAEAKNPENRDNAYILIIDEMNRANLAKVFGELYFLLEYRKETVRLQYRPDEAFFLPPNLFIIGTMNTSDRSIALVDAAIRRRFPFYEMHPSEEPVKSVLERYLEANHITDDRAALLAELNRRMGDSGRDLQIGPSYLMRPEITNDADIDRVWRYDIMPLLEEHYYGQKDREGIRAEFGVTVLRSALPSSSSEADDVDGGSAAPGNAEPSSAEADPAGPAQA